MIPTRAYYNIARDYSRSRGTHKTLLNKRVRWQEFGILRGLADESAARLHHYPLPFDDPRRRRIIAAAITAGQARFYNDPLPQGFRAALPRRKVPFSAHFYGKHRRHLTTLTAAGQPERVVKWAHSVKTSLRASSFVLNFYPDALGLNSAHLNLAQRNPVTVTDTTEVMPTAATPLSRNSSLDRAVSIGNHASKE